MARSLRDINVGIAMMTGVASGYYIFEPVVRAAAERDKAEVVELTAIADVTREPFESVKAQVFSARLEKSMFKPVYAINSWVTGETNQAAGE
jgi:hypothetical protein